MLENAYLVAKLCFDTTVSNSMSWLLVRFHAVRADAEHEAGLLGRKTVSLFRRKTAKMK